MSGMRCLRHLLTALILPSAIHLTAAELRAQSGPVFELQPGMTIEDFVSVPEETPSNTAFSVRFSTRFPTSLKWFTPVAGAVFFPNGTTENSIHNTNAPTIFFGNVFPLVSATRTSGWFSMELPLLVEHAPAAGSSANVRDYGKDLVILPTIYVHIGERMLREFGSVWSRLRFSVQLEQVLTPNKDPISGDRDFFNPSSTFGLSLAIGGSR